MKKEISTLIPAYRKDYFISAINSVLRQTFKPSYIVVSDDSPHGEICKIIQDEDWFSTLNNQNIILQVFTDPRKNSAYFNLMHILDVWNEKTEFFHLLFDDDYIFPSFYDKHLALFQKSDLMVSVSRRWIGDAGGNVVGFNSIPSFVDDSALNKMIIEPASLFKSVVPVSYNWLGEFSNAVFHKSSISLMKSDVLGGYSFYGLIDIGIFLVLGGQRKLAFINEHLGFFRKHGNQNSGNLDSLDFLAAHLAWIPIAIGSEKLGLIDKVQKNNAISHIRNLVESRYEGTSFNKVVKKFFRQPSSSNNIIEPLDENNFLRYWEIFVRQMKTEGSFKL